MDGATVAGYPLSDAHCHLEMYENVEETIASSRKEGVVAMLTAGTTMESNRRIAGLLRFDGVFGVLGIHPEEAVPGSEFVEELRSLVKGNRKIVGIGEIGLDSRAMERKGMDVQKELFSNQLGLAADLNMPVVIHSRGTLADVVTMLEENSIQKAMFHFFSGNEEDALMLEKRGYLMSIPPIESSRLKRVVKAVGIESLVTETDAPAVGKFPSDVRKTVERIAAFKEMTPEDVGFKIIETLKDYFGLIL